MRCPGRMVLHEAPPESQLLPVTHTFASPPLLASAFPSQSTSVRALCSDRLFLGGNLSRGSTVWPSCLETHPPHSTHTHTHIRASIPLQRTSETSANTHTRAWTCTLPPTHLALGQSYPFFFCGGKVELMLWAQAVITSDTPAPGLRNSGYSPKKQRKRTIIYFQKQQSDQSAASKNKEELIYPQIE